MKKAISVLTAAALAAGTLGTLTTSAHQADDGRFEYTRENRPYIYFDIEENESHTVLSDEFVYVNKSKLSDEGDIIKMATYVDYARYIGGVVIYLTEDSGNLKICGYNPIPEYDATPFKVFNNPDYNPVTNQIEGLNNTINIHYLQSGSGYFELTGENTDDYPLAIVDMEVPNNTECGNYLVGIARPTVTPSDDYLHGGIIRYSPSNVSHILDIRPNKNPRDNQTTYELEYTCPYIQISVSDRDLGDINDDNKIDADDAGYLLQSFANGENDYISSMGAYTACDVNGDRVVNDTDAEIVMDYTLLYGNDEQPEVSFEDYVKERIGEE